MNKGLAKLLLAGTGLGLAGMVFDQGSTVDLAGGLYTMAGAIFYIAGSWLAIRILNNK